MSNNKIPKTFAQITLKENGTRNWQNMLMLSLNNTILLRSFNVEFLCKILLKH